MPKRIFLFLLISFIFLSVSSDVFAQTCAAPPAGLTDFWTGDRSANDFVGTKHGTLVNGANFTDDGKVGPTFNFDGADDYVGIPSINIGAAFTLELWIYPTNGGGYANLVANDYTSGNFGSLYFLNNHVEYWQAGTLKAATPTGSASLNAWTHVALVYNGSIVQLYINGVASGAPSGIHAENFNNALRFGYSVIGTDAFFRGRLDEISLYNAALSASEIQSIYNAGTAGKCAAPALLINDASVLEGDAGTSNLDFTVQLLRSNISAQVNYATSDGTATQPDDYQVTSGTTTVPANGAAIVTVSVNGDTTLEQNETLFVFLNSPVNAIIADGQAVGTIFSDDCIPAPLGIADWYKGEGDANDSIGSNHATLENGAAFAVGNTGQAFGLDGINDSVLTPTINLGSAYSIELWVYPTSGTAFQNLVANNYTASNPTTFGTLYFNNNHLEYWQNGGQRAVSPTNIPLNAWTHVALTYNGSLTRLYVNGVLSATSASHAETFNNPVRFGYSVGNTDQHFQGRLDEITLYNQTLADADVLAIYTAGGGGKCGDAGNNWTGAVSSDWHTAGNWSGGVPTAASDVVIPAGAGNQPSIAASDVTVNSLNIAGGRTLTVNAGRNLTVTNDLINSGTLTGAGAASASGAATSNSGTISTANFNFNRTGAQSLSGAGSFASNTATILNGTTLTLLSDHQFDTLIINNGATLDISTRTLSVSGNLSNSGTFTVTDSTVVANGTTPQTLTNTNYQNLTANNPAGVNLGSDATVTHLLTLTSDLQTGAFVLTTPWITASSAGGGDVVGSVRVTSPGFNSIFGNQFNRISITSGTAPTDITVNLTKTAPADFTTAVTRTYIITPTGGANYTATVRLHYLDSELNGNDESMLNLWRRDASWMSQGFTSRNSTENWVEKTGVTQFSPWAIAPGAPSAASVSIGGRVIVGKGGGLSNARVTLTDANGRTRTAITSSFGYYRFKDVEAGQTYIFTVSHKRYSFAPQVVNVTDETNDLNFSVNQ